MVRFGITAYCTLHSFTLLHLVTLMTLVIKVHLKEYETFQDIETDLSIEQQSQQHHQHQQQFRSYRQNLRPAIDDLEPSHMITVTTVLHEPYMMMKSRGLFLTGNDRYEGFLVDLLEELSKSVGFQYSVRLCQDGQYGELGDNTSWIGMIGEIQRQEADLAVGAIAPTPERRQVVQFSEPFATFYSSAIIRRLNSGKRNTRNTVLKIRTLEDLYHSDLNYGVVTNSMTSMLLQNSSDSFYRLVWQSMITAWPSPFVHNEQEGIQRAEHENYAFITDSILADYVTNRHPCHLYKSNHFLERQSYAFAVRQNFTLKPEIDYHITQMRIDGRLQLLFDKWWVDECTKAPERNDRKDRNLRPLKIEPTEVGPRYFAPTPAQNLSNKSPLNKNSLHVNYVMFMVLYTLKRLQFI